MTAYRRRPLRLIKFIRMEKRAKKRKYRLKQGGRCAICGELLDVDKSNFDHRIPVSHGGKNYPWNIQLTHIECNTRKGSQLQTIEPAAKKARV